MVQAKVRGGSPGGRSETKGVGFVKEVVLSREWKRDGVIDVQSDESEEEEVMGEGIGEQEMEELVPEWHRRNVFAETAVCVCVWRCKTKTRQTQWQNYAHHNHTTT